MYVIAAVIAAYAAAGVYHYLWPSPPDTPEKTEPCLQQQTPSVVKKQRFYGLSHYERKDIVDKIIEYSPVSRASKLFAMTVLPSNAQDIMHMLARKMHALVLIGSECPHKCVLQTARKLRANGNNTLLVVGVFDYYHYPRRSNAFNAFPIEELLQMKNVIVLYSTDRSLERIQSVMAAKDVRVCKHFILTTVRPDSTRFGMHIRDD